MSNGGDSIQYENSEIEDTIIVLPHVPRQNAEDILCRLDDAGNGFRTKMSDEMKAKRDQFLRHIEDLTDA
ncbi:hypothetical protein [Shimia sp. W99]